MANHKLVDDGRLSRFLDKLKTYLSTNYQSKLVSGTSIKTVNSTSLLGNGNISISSVSKSSTTVSLTTSGWSNNSKQVTVSGVTSSNDVIVSPAPASYDDFVAAGIKCTAQSSNKLTFSYSTAPTSTITVNVLILT